MPAPVLDPDIWEDVVRAALSSWLVRNFEPCKCDTSRAHAGRCSKHIEFLWRKRYKEDLVTEFVRAEPWLAKADRLRLRELMVLALEAHGYMVLLANTSSSKARVNFPDGTQHRVTGIAMGIVSKENSGAATPIPDADVEGLVSGFASQLEAQHTPMMPLDPMARSPAIEALLASHHRSHSAAAPAAATSLSTALVLRNATTLAAGGARDGRSTLPGGIGESRTENEMEALMPTTARADTDIDGEMRALQPAWEGPVSAHPSTHGLGLGYGALGAASGAWACGMDERALSDADDIDDLTELALWAGAGSSLTDLGESADANDASENDESSPKSRSSAITSVFGFDFGLGALDESASAASVSPPESASPSPSSRGRKRVATELSIGCIDGADGGGGGRNGGGGVFPPRAPRAAPIELDTSSPAFVAEQRAKLEKLSREELIEIALCASSREMRIR